MSLQWHDFKTWYNHLKGRKHSHDTVLSKHISDLKDDNTSYKINRRIVKKVRADTIPFHWNLRLWDFDHSRWFLTNQKIWVHNQMSPWKFLLQHLIKRSAVTTVLDFRVYNWHLFAQTTSLMIRLCTWNLSHICLLPPVCVLEHYSLFTHL